MAATETGECCVKDLSVLVDDIRARLKGSYIYGEETDERNELVAAYWLGYRDGKRVCDEQSPGLSGFEVVGDEREAE